MVWKWTNEFNISNSWSSWTCHFHFAVGSSSNSLALAEALIEPWLCNRGFDVTGGHKIRIAKASNNTNLLILKRSKENRIYMYCILNWGCYCYCKWCKWESLQLSTISNVMSTPQWKNKPNKNTHRLFPTAFFCKDPLAVFIALHSLHLSTLFWASKQFEVLMSDPTGMALFIPSAMY